jgi:hypothetical protein
MNQYIYRFKDSDNPFGEDRELEAYTDSVEKAKIIFQDTLQMDIDEQDIKQITARCWDCNREEKRQRNRIYLPFLPRQIF